MSEYLFKCDETKFDPDRLKSEINARGIDILEIRPGVGGLILKFQRFLNPEEEDVIVEVLAAHSPAGFQISRQGMN